jgi:hypothetical protein
MGDVQAGFTDRMSYQRHVGTFLVFSAGGVQFNLQDLRFFPTYFFGALLMNVGIILIFRVDLASDCICGP